MSSIARNLAVSITDYIKVNASTTLPVPTPYGHIVVDFTGATGTLTFPDMSNVDAGGLITVRKSNETQGEVTNDPGLNPIITGSVVPRQYSDGDFFTYMWDGDRLVLVDGYETGEGFGRWERYYDGIMFCYRRASDVRITDLGNSGEYLLNLPQSFVGPSETRYGTWMPNSGALGTQGERTDFTDKDATCGITSNSWQCRGNVAWDNDLDLIFFARGLWYNA